MNNNQEPSVLYRNYVLFILLAVNTINFIDRTAISVLNGAIQEEFGVSDFMMGVVMGTAFTIFYATLAFPVAQLLDRRKRNVILGAIVAIWSGMTALCGAAASFAQLFLFRVGVGIGEAGAGPASHSLIGDYFRKPNRPAAIGIFSLGVPLGIFLGLTISGYLVDSIGWRWTFVALGLPGLLLALLAWLTIREPLRGGLDDPEDLKLMRAGEQIPLWQGIKLLWSSPTFRIMSYSAAPSALCGYGMNLWMPAFIQRVYELQPSEFSLPLGLSIGVGGGLGAWLGGELTGRVAQRNPKAFLALPGINMVVFAFAMAVVVLTGSLPMVYAAVFVAAFTQFYLMGPFFAVVQRLAPLNGRAVATAFFFFILAMVGLGLGPPVVGQLSDRYAGFVGEADGLRWALGTLAIISLIAGAIAILGRNAVLRDAHKIGGTESAA